MPGRTVGSNPLCSSGESGCELQRANSDGREGLVGSLPSTFTIQTVRIGRFENLFGMSVASQTESRFDKGDMPRDHSRCINANLRSKKSWA